MGGYLLLRDKKVTLGGRHPSGRGAGRVAGDRMDLETVSWCPDRTVCLTFIHGLLCKNVSFFCNSSPTEAKAWRSSFHTGSHSTWPGVLWTPRGLGRGSGLGTPPPSTQKAPRPLCDPLESPGRAVLFGTRAALPSEFGTPKPDGPRAPFCGPPAGLMGTPPQACLAHMGTRIPSRVGRKPPHCVSRRGWGCPAGGPGSPDTSLAGGPDPSSS